MTYLYRSVLVACFILCLQHLAASEVLKVQVVDAITGSPIRAVVLALGQQPRLLSSLTDQKGVAVLDVPSLQGLSVAVRTDTHGFSCISSQGNLSEDLLVKLQPSLRIYGVVKDEDGQALTSVTVKVAYPKDQNCRILFNSPTATTNRQGKYLLYNVDANRDFVIVFHDDFHQEREIRKAEVVGGRGTGPAQA